MLTRDGLGAPVSGTRAAAANHGTLKSHLLGGAAAAAAVGAMLGQQPQAAFAIVALGLLGLSVVAWPDGATLLVLWLTYLSVAPVAINFHHAPVMLALAIPLLLTIPVAYQLSRGHELIVTHGFVLILAFLLVQLLSTLFSIDMAAGWEKVKTFVFEGVAIYLLLLNAIRTPKVLRQAIWVLLAAGASLSALTIFQHVTGTYATPYGGFAQVGREYITGHVSKPRLSGPLGDPNYYAQILIVLAPIGLMLTDGVRSGMRRSLTLSVTGLIIAGIAFTSSRGAGIALVLVVLLMGACRYITGKQLLLIAAGLALLVSAVPDYRDRVVTLVNVAGANAAGPSRHESGTDQSVRSRSTEMLAAALVFSDHPFLGVGPDQFPLYYQEYASQAGGEVHETNKFGANKGEAPKREAHNLFLSIAADLGLAGLAVFLALVLVTARGLVQARRHWVLHDRSLANIATGLLMALIAYLVTGMFLTLAFERYFWLLLALAGATAAIARSEMRDGERAVKVRESSG